MRWEVWIIIAIFLLIIEVFTTTFFFISLAAGAVGAGLAAAFGASIEFQLFLAAIFTLVSFIWARPILQKFSQKHPTNTDALIGQLGRVSERIDVLAGTGRVALDGDDWRAVAVGESFIKMGTQVEVVKVDSTILHVKKI